MCNLGPILVGRGCLSVALEGRDFLLTLVDVPLFLMECRAFRSEVAQSGVEPVGTIRPWRELPIASWVFCLMGTTTVVLGIAVHVGHYRSSTSTARCRAILVVCRACTLALNEIGRFSSLPERGCFWSRVLGVDSF